MILKPSSIKNISTAGFLPSVFHNIAFISSGVDEEPALRSYIHFIILVKSICLQADASGRIINSEVTKQTG
ncbi:MAG TPA: hypothetical protein PLQ06_10820 [Bacteroidales bacterium]|nr:hypothetical protein [Bacteroidales bacterium]